MSLSDTGPCTEFQGKLVQKSPKAFQIEFEEHGLQWIPISQCEWSGKDTWLLTDWIAEQKEMK